MSAGITSQYGFLYQRFFFIKAVLDNIGMDKFFTYEGIDDVDISETDSINGVTISNEMFIQVKSGTVSRNCWAKVLGNWLLIDHVNPKYKVILENELTFDIYDKLVISEACKYFSEGKTKKASSIANKVYKKYAKDDKDVEALFRKKIEMLLPTISFEVLSFDALLENIKESFVSVYCQDIKMFEMAKKCRCDRFIDFMNSKIDFALGKKKSYTLRYQDFIGILNEVTSEISDQKYTINISEMKKRKKTEAEKIMNGDEHREVRQLRLVNSNSGFIIKELVNELLYRDFRDVYSTNNNTLINNILDS